MVGVKNKTWKRMNAVEKCQSYMTFKLQLMVMFIAFLSFLLQTHHPPSQSPKGTHPPPQLVHLTDDKSSTDSDALDNQMTHVVVSLVQGSPRPRKPIGSPMSGP